MNQDDPREVGLIRRIGWGRILGIAFVLLIALVFLVHTLWAKAEASRVRNEMARLAAAGEPMSADYFIDPPLPDEQNIAFYVREAAKAQVDGSVEAVLQYARNIRLPLSTREQKLLEIYLAQQAPALKILEGLTGLTQSASFDSPQLFPSLNGVRSMANLERAAAVSEADKGRFDLAMDHLDRIEKIQLAVGGNQGLVGMLVAVGCRAVHDDALTGLIPYLRIGTAPGELPPERIRAKIVSLLDERRANENLLRAFQHERVFQPQMIDLFMQGKQPVSGIGGATPMNGPLRWAMGPVASQAKRECLAYMNELVRVVPTATDLADFQRKNAQAAALFAKAKGGLNPISSIMIPSLDRAVETHFRAKNERRLCATLLAAKLYELEKGQPPRQLVDLVPDYLPAIPGDPMGDAEPIRYRAEPTPIVWSVGVNRTNEDGAEAEIDQNEYDAKLKIDFVRHLAAKPRFAQLMAARRATPTTGRELPIEVELAQQKDPIKLLMADLVGVFRAANAESDEKVARFEGRAIWTERAGEAWLLAQFSDPAAPAPIRGIVRAVELIDGSVCLTPFDLKDGTRWDALWADASTFSPVDFNEHPEHAMYFAEGAGFTFAGADSLTRYVRIDGDTLFIGEVKDYDWIAPLDKLLPKYAMYRQEPQQGE